MGQFVHLIRRNVPMLYIVENNGVYGLTKGQFSATADRGSKAKKGVINDMEPIDCCALAIELGCGFVARSFAADKKQLESVLKAAMAYQGTAFVDVVSPCITFNNHAGSTKSYDWGKENEEPIHELGFVPHWETQPVEVPEGGRQVIPMSDGSRITVRKIERDFDPTNRIEALKLLHESRKQNEFLTGLFYVSSSIPTFTEQLNLVPQALSSLPESTLRPGREALAKIMADLA
jgi:2-oxoglutarate ferredoxin oxidoreductase subunit beta